MNPLKHTDSRSKALGTTFAATPPMLELKAEAEAMLQSGATRDQVREHLRARAVSHDGMGLRAFLGINRKIARFSAAKVVRLFGDYWAKRLQKRSVQEALAEWAAKQGFDTWLADFVLGWIDSDEAPALAGTHIMRAGTFAVGPANDKTEVVYVGMNALGDPREAAQAFLDECARTFPPETWSRKGFAERDAKRFALFATGHTDFEIAKAELEAEGWPHVAANKREYNQGVKSRANSVLVSRNRWSEYVTQLVEPVSRS